MYIMMGAFSVIASMGLFAMSPDCKHHHKFQLLQC